jgi:hypothetical protein
MSILLLKNCHKNEKYGEWIEMTNIKTSPDSEHRETFQAGMPAIAVYRF